MIKGMVIYSKYFKSYWSFDFNNMIGKVHNKKDWFSYKLANPLKEYFRVGENERLILEIW